MSGFWDVEIFKAIPLAGKKKLVSYLFDFEDAAGDGTLMFRAFLKSPTGVERPQLDGVTATFTPPVNPPFISGISPTNGAGKKRRGVNGEESFFSGSN